MVGVGEPDPDDLLSGLPFVRAGITGAVESDFFDWVLARAEGVDLVRRVVRQVGRFRHVAVETDVLKVLYESLIDPAERHDLGEYYTPDWLAGKVCRAAIVNPLNERVIDPACGSGTFLFHAVRMHLAAATNAKTDIKQRAQVACGLIAGIDIHPVSIIIARVTFLLALGEVLAKRSSGISIPVYLGDALQLNVRGMFMGEELVVIVPPKAGEGEHKDLHFPKSVCEFPDLFDQILETMRVASESGMRPQAFEARVKAVLGDKGKTFLDRDLDMLRESYEELDGLRREGRDTLWSYVARNLSRPLHLSSAERRADVVAGNPPWARVPLHVGWISITLQGSSPRRARLCRRQARDAGRSFCAVLRQERCALPA